MRTVAVIGAGIIGASVARHTTRCGLATLVLEAADAPATATSAASFSRATAFGKDPEAYFDLNHAGLGELQRLRTEGAPGFQPCPSLVWTQQPHRVAALADTARQRGYQATCAPPTHTELAPGVVPADPPRCLAHLPAEGWVDLPALTEWSLQQARGLGAQVLLSSPVARVRTDDGAVTGVELADGRTLHADVVVNAAGTRAQQIASPLGGALSLSPTQGLLADLPMPAPLGAMVLAPGVSIRPHGPGRVRVRSQEIDLRLENQGPTRAEHEELLADLVERAAAVVPALRGAPALSTRIGVRVFPSDGLPSIGPLASVPGYYEAVTHSGATLGPLLGRLVAEELSTARRPALLAPYTPDRFTPRHQPEPPATTAHQ